MQDNQYPKYKVLWYFENVEPIIQGHVNTSIFDDSLLVFVDEFCDLFDKGKLTPKPTAGGPNWYIEFWKFVEDVKGVKMKFKQPCQIN